MDVFGDAADTHTMMQMIDMIDLSAEYSPLPSSTAAVILHGLPRCSTMTQLIHAAGFADALDGCRSRCTVCAPSNEAFKSSQGLVENLLLPDNQPVLVNFLKCHFIVGTQPVVSLIDQSTFNTFSDGVVLHASAATINGAHVLEADLHFCNGIVHVVDAILVRPTFPHCPVGSRSVQCAGNKKTCKRDAPCSGTRFVAAGVDEAMCLHCCSCGTSNLVCVCGKVLSNHSPSDIKKHLEGLGHRGRAPQPTLPNAMTATPAGQLHDSGGDGFAYQMWQAEQRAASISTDLNRYHADVVALLAGAIRHMGTQQAATMLHEGEEDVREELLQHALRIWELTEGRQSQGHRGAPVKQGGTPIHAATPAQIQTWAKKWARRVEEQGVMLGQVLVLICAECFRNSRSQGSVKATPSAPRAASDSSSHGPEGSGSAGAPGLPVPGTVTRRVYEVEAGCAVSWSLCSFGPAPVRVVTTKLSLATAQASPAGGPAGGGVASNLKALSVLLEPGVTTEVDRRLALAASATRPAQYVTLELAGAAQSDIENRVELRVGVKGQPLESVPA